MSIPDEKVKKGIIRIQKEHFMYYLKLKQKKISQLSYCRMMKKSEKIVNAS